MTELEDINSLEQTAEFLKITEYQVKELVRLGKIGSVKVGRTRTFPRDAIETFVRENTIAPKPPNPHGLTDASWRRVQGRRRI